MIKFLKQLTPLLLSVLTFFLLIFVLFIFIEFLNHFSLHTKILLSFSIVDILVGLTIYLKTSVDFALFIGNLMSKFVGMKNRIAIEIGTALGNAIGTFFVLAMWTFFKEVPLLMIAMILLASLILFQMSEEGLYQFQILNFKFQIFAKGINVLLLFVNHINSFFKPLLKWIIPHSSTTTSAKKTFFTLFLFSLSIPLILGLDDFAGYIPLFTIVNVVGFAIGVFLGHMLLNIALFASPHTTIRIVKQPIISFLGSLAFIGIALWGCIEALQILLKLL